MQINIPGPQDLSINKEDYHAGRFVAVITLALAAVVAGYQGWILIPNLATIGGIGSLLVAVVAVAAIIFAATTDSKAMRLLAVVAAFLAGLFAQPVWSGLREFATELSWGQVAGLLIGIAVTLVVASWCARRH